MCQSAVSFRLLGMLCSLRYTIIAFDLKPHYVVDRKIVIAYYAPPLNRRALSDVLSDVCLSDVCRVHRA